MLKAKRLTQIGDTIVEVLLAVVIVGLAIGLGYGVASRSLKANRQAQERGEALKKVEGQLERLKKRAVTDGADTGVFGAGAFCIADTEGITNNIEDLEPAPPAKVDEDPLGNTYNSACIDGLYHLSIKADTSNPSTQQFSVTARWFGFGGRDKEETTIKYRVYSGI